MEHTTNKLKILTFIVIIITFSNIGYALIYTKNSFPTYSGGIISCDGNDLRISCYDSGDGRNHWCNEAGYNSCQAFEGRNNYGSAGCLITCKKEEVSRCTDGTQFEFCSANIPFFCEEGNLIQRASVCGCPSNLARYGDNCIQPVLRCGDSTLYGLCSVYKPLFCDNGNLVNKASMCGCSSGEIAVGDNCITPPLNCSDGTQNSQCSQNKPSLCLNGTLVNRAFICGCPANLIASGDDCVNGTIGTGPQTSISLLTKLIIADIDAKVDAKNVRNIKDNGKIKENAEPGSGLELEINIKNNFTANENIKISSIQVDVTFENIDNGNDIRAESDLFDLRPQADKTVRLKFRLPINAEEGDYNIVIEAEGEDDNGNVYRADADIELEIEKEEHSLKFLDFSFSPAVISCNRDMFATIKIINIGKENEEDAILEIKSEELGVDLRERVSISSGTENNLLSKIKRFSISNNTDKKDTFLTASIYSGDGVVRDKAVASLSVLKCFQQGVESKTMLFMPIQEMQNITITKKELLTYGIFTLDDTDKMIVFLILFSLIFILLIIFAFLVLYERG